MEIGTASKAVILNINIPTFSWIKLLSASKICWFISLWFEWASYPFLLCTLQRIFFRYFFKRLWTLVDHRWSVTMSSTEMKFITIFRCGRGMGTGTYLPWVWLFRICKTRNKRRTLPVSWASSQERSDSRALKLLILAVCLRRPYRVDMTCCHWADLWSLVR